MQGIMDCYFKYANETIFPQLVETMQISIVCDSLIESINTSYVLIVFMHHCRNSLLSLFIKVVLE